jgi:hypothetical protein
MRKELRLIRVRQGFRALCDAVRLGPSTGERVCCGLIVAVIPFLLSFGLCIAFQAPAVLAILVSGATFAVVGGSCSLLAAGASDRALASRRAHIVRALPLAQAAWSEQRERARQERQEEKEHSRLQREAERERVQEERAAEEEERRLEREMEEEYGPGSYTVRVSARILSFPGLCCCCTQEEGHQRYCAKHTRTTGVEVIRTDTRWWEFPICGRCLRWIGLEQDANRWHGSFAALVVFGLLALVGGIIYGIAVASEAEFDADRISRPAILAAYIVCLCGLLLLVLSPLALWAYRKAQAKADWAKPHLVCSTQPVIYDGWDGSVHTFTFSNVAYSALFIRSNAKKILG